MRLLKSTSLKSAYAAALFAWPVLAFGNSFSPAGAERVIAGSQRGDQTRPQAAMNPAGGFLVWEDNNADNSGLGVRAQRLDASLNRSGAAFRVNVQPAGDQEKPQVAMLRNGGAIFAWQGGKRGAQRIYARFLNANGTFVSGDVRANTYTNGFQIDPAVASLADGSAVVVWSSYGQDGSLLGVYAQRFSPNGARLGGELRVNQFSANNQRSPVVAGLTNGSFVVAWVSELQRSSASVDIFARLFSADGTPQGGEFAVNSNVEKACANPSIDASLLTGCFAVVWGQDDNRRLATSSVNTNGTAVTNAAPRSMSGWDILGRVFGPGGNSLTGETVLNQTTYGDQYAPVVRAFGEDFGVVWTDHGQDGNREGAYGRFWNADGTLNGSEFRVNTTVISRQIQPVIASDNHSKMLAVWTSYLGGGTGFELVSQSFSSAEVIPLERLASSLPQIQEPNTGRPRLLTPDAAEFAEPVPNGFAVAAGTYQGLFFDKYGVGTESSGYLTVKTTVKGGYSGKLQLAGKSHSFKGTFDDSGWAASVINRSGNTPLTVYLQINLSGGGNLRGGVSDGDWWADLQGDRQVFSTGSPTQLAGSYTLIIRGSTNGPAGSGIGTLKVSSAGAIAFKGTLADGTKITQKSVVSREGYWPFYSDIGKGRGVLLGWLQFANEVESDFDGTVVWSRSPNVVAPNYPAGFVSAVDVIGSRYAAPASGQRVLNLTQGALALSGAQLGLPLTYGINLGANSAVTGDPALKLSFASKDGSFKGTVATGPASLAFQGVVLQKSVRGGGYFLNGSQSGEVRLTAVP